MNVADDQSIITTVSQVINRLGRIDILINIAVIEGNLFLLGMTPDFWEQAATVNLKNHVL